MLKTVYLYDETTGAYTGMYNAHPSPMEPGVFLEPAGSTPIEPPAADDDQVAVFIDGAWSIVSVAL